jgi:putative oxidoreductase
MERFFWICVAGAAGTGARYLVALWAAQRFGSAFPYGTLIVNLLGCFALAAVMHAALAPQGRANPPMLRRLLKTDASNAVVLIRLMVGAVFLSEGVQKFLFPDQLGAGRFTKIGIPAPEVLGPFVGTVEIICGTLVLLGLATRLAAVPLLGIMTVALATTKYPILMDKGFWTAVHEARTDWSMFLGSLFLILVGAGSWSVDVWLTKGHTRKA